MSLIISPISRLQFRGISTTDNQECSEVPHMPCAHRGTMPLLKIEQNGESEHVVIGHEGMALNGQKVGLD